MSMTRVDACDGHPLSAVPEIMGAHGITVETAMQHVFTERHSAFARTIVPMHIRHAGRFS
jgi:hypothetical protein